MPTSHDDDQLDIDEAVGDHPEPDDVVIIKNAPKTKVIKNSSKGVAYK